MKSATTTGSPAIDQTLELNQQQSNFAIECGTGFKDASHDTSQFYYSIQFHQNMFS
jgi:hypothetical protein